jgi:hypothetical protein
VLPDRPAPLHPRAAPLPGDAQAVFAGGHAHGRQ